MPRPFACPARARPAVYVPLAVRVARPVGPRLASVARFSVPPSINRGLARGYATEKEAGGGGPGGAPGGGAGGEPGGDGAGAPGAEGAAGSGGIDEEPRATQTTRGLEEDADEAADRELENETGFDPDPLYAFVAPPVLTLFYSNETSDAQQAMEEDDILYADATANDDLSRQNTGATATR